MIGFPEGQSGGSRSSRAHVNSSTDVANRLTESMQVS